MNIVLATTPSDSHMWNLVYLETLLSEHGIKVSNLGCCTPYDLILKTCNEEKPDLLVVSSVNGHGAQEGIAMMRFIDKNFDFPVVIGGKLAVTEEQEATWVPKLITSGFDRVFTGDDSIDDFLDYLATKQPIPQIHKPKEVLQVAL